MVVRNRNPPWSELPQEILSAIANLLTSNPISIFSFRSICCSWRSSCPRLSNSPILSPPLPLTVPFSSDSCRFHRNSSDCSILSVTIIYALRRPLHLSEPEFSSLSPDAWILFVDEFTAGKPSIRKPFSTVSYYTPINFPNNINLIDSNVRELGRFHNLSFSTYYDMDLLCKVTKPRFCVTDLNKVVMFPNEVAAITLREDGTLELCSLEEMNEGYIECGVIHDGKGARFDDIVEFKGRVLGIDRRGRVYQINYRLSQITPFVAPIAGGGGRRKRLVESLGRLYLVVRSYVDPGHNNKCKRLKEEIRKIRFKVYELNEGKKKWIEISSLGDRSFSFGRNFSFSASAQELGTCVKNCILFTSQSFLSYSSNADDYTGFKWHGRDIGVCHLHEADHFCDIKSYPGYSDSLWPPPNWIWSIDRLKRIGIVETAIDKTLDSIPDNFKTEVERAGDHYNEFGQPFVLPDLSAILKLKKLVIGFREEEIEFMTKLQESMTKLRESMDILNKAHNLCEQARTGSHGSDRTTEDRLGWPDNLKTGQTRHDHLLQPTTSMLRKRDAFLLDIEEQATEVQLSLKHQLENIPTLLQ